MRNHSWASDDLRELTWALGNKSKERFHVNNNNNSKNFNSDKIPGALGKKLH